MKILIVHGIFTYHFARVLREAKTSGFAPTLAQIKEQTGKDVSGKFKYQNPRLVAPSEKLNQVFSWQRGAK